MEQLPGASTSYEQLLLGYMLPNKPVLLTGLAATWPACRDWALPCGGPDMAAFAASFPAGTAGKLTDCDAPDVRRPCLLADYASWWEEASSAARAGGQQPARQRLYFKDLHITKASNYQAYELPAALADDW